MFITFEGGEGSGKSLQAKTLYRRLIRAGLSTILLHEPGCTPLGDKLTRLLKWGREMETCPVSELMLFNASRAQLVCDVIRPALIEGQIVVCDRYTDSTVAYQGYAGSITIESVEAVNKIATGILVPDVTFLLDIPAGEGLARKQNKPRDRFEEKDIVFHEKVRQGYLEMAKNEPGRFQVIDARMSKGAIARIIWDMMRENFSIGQKAARS